MHLLKFAHIIYIKATPYFAQWYHHTYWRFVTLVCRWKERPSSDRTPDERKSAIRFHKISINRLPSGVSNSMGKRDRKSCFSTHWRNSSLTRFVQFIPILSTTDPDYSSGKKVICSVFLSLPLSRSLLIGRIRNDRETIARDTHFIIL